MDVNRAKVFDFCGRTHAKEYKELMRGMEATGSSKHLMILNEHACYLEMVMQYSYWTNKQNIYALICKIGRGR